VQILLDVLGFAIFIAGIIGIVRWNKVKPSYHPFIILTWLACINVSLSELLVANGYTTVVNNNFYMLLESLLILWFFVQQGLFRKSTRVPVILAMLFFCLWLAEAFIWQSKYGHVMWFQIFNAFVIVLMSIATINRLLVFGRRSLITDALFLICMAFVLYFTFTIFVYAFLLYGFNESVSLSRNIFFIRVIVDFISNLIFAYAALRIPKKDAFLQAKMVRGY
jgi:hypothetical protein